MHESYHSKVSSQSLSPDDTLADQDISQVTNRDVALATASPLKCVYNVFKMSPVSKRGLNIFEKLAVL